MHYCINNNIKALSYKTYRILTELNFIEYLLRNFMNNMSKSWNDN